MAYYGDWVNNQLYSFKIATGLVVASASVGGNFVTSTPLILTGSQIVATTDSPSAQMFNLNRSSMAINWKIQTGYVGGSPVAGPTDYQFIIARNDGHISRMTSPGKTVWDKSGFGKPRGMVVFSPDNTQVYISNGINVSALSYADGSTLWTRSLTTTAGAPSVADDGTIIVGCDGGKIFGLKPTTGGVKWTRTVGGEVRAGAAIGRNGVAYVGSLDQRLYAVDIATGTQKWSYLTTMWCECSPLIGTDNTIYVHNKNGDVYAFNTDGTVKWRVNVGGEARGSMSMDKDGTLFVGHTGGSQSGLAIIRQLPTASFFDTLTMKAGQKLSGGVGTLRANDLKFTSLARGAADHIELELWQDVPDKSLADLDVNLADQASRTGVARTIELYNMGTGSWELVGSGDVATTIAAFTLTVTGNPSRYVDQTTKMVRLRIKYSSSDSSDFNVQLNQATLSQSPTFHF